MKSHGFQNAKLLVEPAFGLPTGWSWKPLGHAVKQRKEVILLNDDDQYLRVTVQLHGRGIRLRDRVHGRQVKTKKQFVTRKNDLLVAEIDAKMGAFGIVPEELDGGIVSSHYFAFEIDQSLLLPKFVAAFVRIGYLTAGISEFVRGSLNYAAIRPRHVEAIPFPVPSLDVQAEIVGQMHIADEIATDLREQLSAAEALPLSIVRHSLGGVELPQTHSD